MIRYRFVAISSGSQFVIEFETHEVKDFRLKMINELLESNDVVVKRMGIDLFYYETALTQIIYEVLLDNAGYIKEVIKIN